MGAQAKTKGAGQASRPGRRRSKAVALGLLLTAGVSLAACSEGDWNEEEEEGYYGSNNHSRVYYSRLGSPYYRHDDNILRPLPSDHPHYPSAVREGQAIATGQQAYSDHVNVRRGGFGSSSTLHVSSHSAGS